MVQLFYGFNPRQVYIFICILTAKKLLFIFGKRVFEFEVMVFCFEVLHYWVLLSFAIVLAYFDKCYVEIVWYFQVG